MQDTMPMVLISFQYLGFSFVGEKEMKMAEHDEMQNRT